MLNNRGSSLVSTILAVAAAGGVGVAGYFLVAGNCGSCSTETAAATPVAAVEGDSCCPGEAAAGEVIAVAAEAEGCATECATECTEEQKAACESACTGEAGVELVANTEAGEACSGEKAEACSAEAKAACTDAEKAACEGEAKVCPVTGEPIADAGN